MIELRVEGEKELLAGLERLHGSRARRDLLDQIGAYGLSSTQERFLQQADPEGESWEQSRRAREEGGQTLRDSNRLFQSLTFESTADSVAWGSNVVYAGIHQFGGEIRPKNALKLSFRTATGFVSIDKVTMPARPYLGINDEDRTEIRAIIEGWFTETLQ